MSLASGMSQNSLGILTKRLLLMAISEDGFGCPDEVASRDVLLTSSGQGERGILLTLCPPPLSTVSTTENPVLKKATSLLPPSPLLLGVEKTN